MGTWWNVKIESDNCMCSYLHAQPLSLSLSLSHSSSLSPGREIYPAHGAWFIPHIFISHLPMVIPGPVLTYSAVSWLKHCPPLSLSLSLSLSPSLSICPVVIAPWFSGSTLDCRSTGQAIDPAPGVWLSTKIHLISPGCPWLSIAVQCRIVA